MGTRKQQKEPLINLKLGPHGQEVVFLVDTGAERSTIQFLPKGCTLSKETATVVGAKGEPFEVKIMKGVMIESPSKLGIGDFLLVPESEYNLLGRDMIVELGIRIDVVEKELQVKLCPLRLEDEEKINPEVWYTPGSAGQLKIAPFKVKIKNPEIPVRIKQYQISPEGRRGLKPEIERLLNQGLLEPCMSPFNTPILPVKKADR